MRLVLLLALSVVGNVAAAQPAGSDSGRGSAPPGISRDGSRPAEGAIQGGSIAPGETGGVPQQDPAAREPGSAAAGGSAKAIERCYELEGTLRKQCLADHEVNREGATPRAPSGSAAPAPRRD